MISQESQTLKEMIRSSNLWNRPLPELRQLLTQLGQDVPLPQGIREETVDAGGMKAHWLIPPEPAAGPVIFYLHGGGYCLGITGINRAFVGQIAADSGLKVLMADYRLAPENPFPAGLEDCISGYRWLLGTGHAPENIIVMGDSSGCGLALVMLSALKKAAVPLPNALVFICPALDFSHSGESHKTRAEADPYRCEPEFFVDAHYVQHRNPQDPEISPLFGSFDGLPPLLIHGAGDDIFLSDSLSLAEKATVAGCDVTLKVWDGLWHIFHMSAAMIPEGKAAMEEIMAFLRKYQAKV